MNFASLKEIKQQQKLRSALAQVVDKKQCVPSNVVLVEIPTDILLGFITYWKPHQKHGQ
jgi:hypothetical protein